MSTLAVGIDIGGTGIKGALVDTQHGELASERVKVATPDGGDPDAVLAAVAEMVAGFGDDAAEVPVGVCFPAIVSHGRTMSAANVSDRWIGLDAEGMFEKTLHRGIHFVNDADAAGVAEVRFGAAAGVDGLVIMTTLGTGIGSAFLHDGVLVPNTELGHLEIDGADAESRASYAAKEREDLDWEAWAQRLQRYYAHVEFLFSPELFIVGGGVSKHHEEFLPLLDLRTPIVPAALRNNAGIQGAAWLAARSPRP
ncbi:polyphosphate--glucose phosphotransferase [Protaetiibacter mangrovi]|uniref:ROK family protein n=1 Tax=Protaetiibacter mangrovi TaxID=2970926 RepID=A0ABT1ZBM5_9MICO|nr:ROK family protein [Protaetiibacter mangrovi]MCS0498102.1 ROK family protein [Protaetiibacter mangrovi]TPX03485.1 ROK family protein [Schumannella luteola]